MRASEPRLRPAVRALLVDEDDRALLVRFEQPGIAWWAAPGGGAEPGERPLDTLRRELSEEVGLDLGGTVETHGVPVHVWHRTFVAAGVIPGWDGQVDDFYLVRCAEFAPRGSLTDEQLADEGMTAARWWSPAELASPGDTTFAPRDLPTLLASLLRDGPPAAPLQLGE